MEVRKETPSLLDAASIATRNEGTTKSGDVGERMESVVPPTPPMSSFTAPKAKRASRLSMWKTNRRKVSSKIYPMDTPVPKSAQSHEVNAVPTAFSTPLQPRKKGLEEKIVDTDEKRNVETSTIVDDITGIKTTKTTMTDRN